MKKIVKEKVPFKKEIRDKKDALKLFLKDELKCELIEEKEVATDTGKRVILTYDGEKSFTIVQEKTTVVPTMTVSTSLKGELVDLGFTVAAMTEQSIRWTNNGVDYMLASNDLTPSEMVMVAQSVQGSMVE